MYCVLLVGKYCMCNDGVVDVEFVNVSKGCNWLYVCVVEVVVGVYLYVLVDVFFYCCFDVDEFCL